MKFKILVVFLCLANFSFSQTLVLNQTKYWDYRKVLKERYIQIGSGKGKSIPAEFYNPKKGRLHWGDGTMALGWYIGVLATEYHLSSKNGFLETGEGKAIDPKQTLIELSYALDAVDRLDLAAEPFFDKNAKPNLNGFLLRDDVGREFQDKFEDVSYLDSDYVSERPYNNEMSHDQTYQLMIGLALVKNFIPAKTQVGGVLLYDQAVHQATRILKRLSVDNWRLRNPVVYPDNNKKGKKVDRGHQAYIYSAGTKKMMKYFGGEKMKVSLLNSIYWRSLRMGINPTYVENNNSFMAFTIASIGNGFKRNSYRKLVKRSKRNNWYIYPLLNKALYPLNRDIDFALLEKSQAMMDEAPAGGIVSNYGRKVSHSWGVNNSFFKFKKYQKDGLSYQVDREYNGLDYMLFYNLWMINRTGLFKDSWKLLAPQTRKEKRADRKAREKFMEQEKNIEIIDE